MSLFHQRECHSCGQPCDGYYCDSCTCTRCGMTLFNGTCDNCIYRNGKPLICTACGSMVKGGLCLPCDFKEKILYNCDPNAYSFDNSNYFPRPEYENYLCNLCGNNSHDGYDCQQQFLLVYEQEPSYNQNYNAQNIDFSGSDQIQTPQYPEIHLLSKKISNEVFQANHSVQYKESLENSLNEIDVSSSNEEKEEPSQDSDIRHLIREECCIEVPEKQKQNMEDTMLELVKICQEIEFLCIHDDVDDLIESALNSKLLLINSNSQRLDKKEQEVKNVVEQPAELYDDNFEDIEYVEASLPDPEIVSVEEENDVEEENVVQQEEEEIDLEDISQIQDVVLREKLLSITHLISNIESLNDNPIPDRVLNSFESDSLLNYFSPEFETFCDHLEETRSGNTTHADNSLSEYDSFCFKIKPDQERLIYLVKNDISDDSSNDPLLEKVYLFLPDNSIPPGIENFANDPEGDIRFLEELLIDDSVLSHESSNSNFKDNPLIPRPPLEPPDVETDAGEELPVLMNDKDKFDEDYLYFMIVKVFSFLFAESEDTIFDLGISD
nr:hypothetical protein [Tanacetum cinerariifolium]